jgi:exopolysaccharide biosynthesis predicted pyruvyltransferase EpsI
MLTPSARMGNLGDQAQAVAVERWLRDRLRVRPIEVDKDEYASLARVLRWIIRPGELILLESGGNLGERGIVTERLRRRIIDGSRRNPIVILPQTISFSGSPSGRAEAESSSAVYGRHPSLDVVARDAVSLEEGARLFPGACHIMAPDPVLTLAGRPRQGDRSGVLLVFRNDRERRLDAAQRQAIESALEGRLVDRFDTKVDYPVRRGRRDAVITDILDRFARHELVVTDRFHGMVFAYVTDTPCVVLENIDHKIRSGFEWLAECPAIRLVSPDEPLEPLIEEVLAAPRPSECGATSARLEAAFAELAELVRSRLARPEDR